MEDAQSHVHTWVWQQGTKLVMAPFQSSFFHSLIQMEAVFSLARYLMG